VATNPPRLVHGIRQWHCAGWRPARSPHAADCPWPLASTKSELSRYACRTNRGVSDGTKWPRLNGVTRSESKLIIMGQATIDQSPAPPLPCINSQASTSIACYLQGDSPLFGLFLLGAHPSTALSVGASGDKRQAPRVAGTSNGVLSLDPLCSAELVVSLLATRCFPHHQRGKHQRGSNSTNSTGT
jgi:hypothetical protein